MIRRYSTLVFLLLAACAPRYKGPVTDHFNGKKFVNTGPPVVRQGGLFKWLLHRDKGPWLDNPNAQPGPKPQTRIYGDSLVVTFVGHSSFLLQTDGLNILTDPVWSNKIGPTKWLGIKRRRPPGIRYEDLPPIDVVMLSHCHYDHLDLHTLKRLAKDFNPLMVTPLGVSYLPKKVGGKTTRELDWNDTLRVLPNLTVTATEARHFSNRGMGDRDRTLWAGYLLHTRFGTIYFAGDTGYGDLFPKIAQRAAQSPSGPVKLAMLPIGSYRPTWFMAPVHMSPIGAVQAFSDLGRPQTVGIHFGTFQQGDDGLFEPRDDLTAELLKQKIPLQRFTVPVEGKGVVYK
ncbi:MBL fold metallo-hydrolase [Fibrella aquatilis]|uniref:MBL fold metallo-hydrolase n=1 Tax=Fibrella aquatilis TaxID=2817059 RepID=A0A939G5K4_9BACT|nr:MBL fold metallo-hydrolase [Fibrella aquatilis]MBO0932787.1 MBL fold metallo-hydrolase [Fibrella aquatilis]